MDLAERTASFMETPINLLSWLFSSAFVSFAPLAMVLAWHVVTLLISVGMFFLVVEEYDDLDSGLIGFIVFFMGLAGVLLGKIAGVDWSWALLPTLPSFSIAIVLLTKRQSI